MNSQKHADESVTRLGAIASRSLGSVEIIAHIVLGLLLALAALLGVGSAAESLWTAATDRDNAMLLVAAVDRLLFVLMIVEILHTVRVSFSSGELRCQPFLVVGLIASIRRMLVITLESSQVHQPDRWSPEAQVILRSTMQELIVLGGLILVLVVSIYMLRRSRR
jgi:uncharacterized membrane protein (DUF373 family)